MPGEGVMRVASVIRLADDQRDQLRRWGEDYVAAQWS